MIICKKVDIQGNEIKLLELTADERIPIWERCPVCSLLQRWPRLDILNHTLKDPEISFG